MTITLKQYTEKLLSEKDHNLDYQTSIRSRIRNLCEWAGCELTFADLTSDLINNYLVHLRSLDLKPATMSSYRANIVTIWNAAYMDKLIDEPPLRVRRVKKPRLLVECYTHDEIQQLLVGASRLEGYDKFGNKRAQFWQALIHGAYSTGLRRGDLLAVPKVDIRENGIYSTIQQKTDYRITVQFSQETLAHAARLKSPRGLLIHWPYHISSITWAFRRVRNHAGISRGSIRWLRRSAGTYAEAAQPGAGAKALGHRNESVFRNHYEDTGITATKAFAPPPLPPSLKTKRRPATARSGA